MKKPCPLCMSLRAKFVRWLGMRLGVMEPIKQFKEKPMESTSLSQMELLAVLGQKELDVTVWRKRCGELEERLKKYEPEQKPELEVVK